MLAISLEAYHQMVLSMSPDGLDVWREDSLQSLQTLTAQRGLDIVSALAIMGAEWTAMRS